MAAMTAIATALAPAVIGGAVNLWQGTQARKQGDKMAQAAAQAAAQQRADIGIGIDEMRGDIGRGIDMFGQNTDRAMSIIRDSYGRAIPVVTDAYGRAQGSLDSNFQAGIDAFGNKYDEAQNYLRPMIDQYDPARGRAVDASGANGQAAQQAYYDSLQFGPGFEAERAAGIAGIEDSRAASGMLRSGGTLTELQDRAMLHFSDYLNKDKAYLAELAARGDTARGAASSLAGQAAPNLLAAYATHGRDRAALDTGLGKDTATLMTGQGTAESNLLADQAKYSLDALTKQGITTAQARAGQGAASGAGTMNAANADAAGTLGFNNAIAKGLGGFANLDFNKMFGTGNTTTAGGVQPFATDFGLPWQKMNLGAGGGALPGGVGAFPY